MAIQDVQMITEFEAQVLADLSVLKNQMLTLMGDGDSGRLPALERKVELHELHWQRAKGFAAAMGVLFTMVQVAVEMWHQH